MTGRLVAGFLLALYLVTAGGKGYSIDGAFGYEMAKTVFLDPEHSYFNRFKTAFARWGALMPLLGQPLVLAGDALSRFAPQRDALTVDGHTFRVEEWPAIEAGSRFAAPLPEGSAATVDSIALISFLSNNLQLPHGTVVAQVRVWDGERSTDLPIRAGIETAEWAYDRPDVAGKAGHGRPRVAGHWIGQPRGNLYYARLELPAAQRVTRWELLGSSTAAQWHVRAAAFHTSDGDWQNAYTNARYWSERQTRDFFAHLFYSSTNAFTTAASAWLIYAILGLFGFTLSVRVLSAFGYGAATMAWPYAKLDFSEPASTCFLLLATWALYRAFPPACIASSDLVAEADPSVDADHSSRALRGERSTAGAFRLGMLAALGLLLAVVGKYTAALGAAAVLVQWAFTSRWWHPAHRARALAFAATTALPAGLAALAGVAVMAVVAGETPVLFSNALDRVREDWLALPLWIGLRGLLFSPGKSLFLYSPWLLLALPGAVLMLRRFGWHALLFTLFPAVTIALYSMKLVWHGGGWGPRYLVPIVPLLAIAAAPAVEWCLRRGASGRATLAVMAVLSVGVQLFGIAKDPEQFPAMAREHVVAALPEMGSRLGGRDYWLARGGDGMARALIDPDPKKSSRGLGYVWGLPDAQVEFRFAEERTVDLSLYFVDWDRQARRQQVTIEDARGRREWPLDFDFSGGIWASWQVTGSPDRPVRVSLAQRGPDTSVVSAATFDAPDRFVTQQTQPQLDRETRGDWRDRYGRDGFVLFAWHSFNIDLARRPPYVAAVEATHVGDKPDPRIHVEIAEQDLLDTPLLYALPFSPLLGNAWLLAADLANLLLPARPDVTQGVLLRPPWVWFGIGAPRIERPEFGLGLDFWPTLLYTAYASHTGVLVAMWTVLLALEAALVGTGAALLHGVWQLPRRLIWRWAAVAVLVLAFYNLLLVSA